MSSEPTGAFKNVSGPDSSIGDRQSQLLLPLPTPRMSVRVAPSLGDVLCGGAKRQTLHRVDVAMPTR